MARHPGTRAASRGRRCGRGGCRRWSGRSRASPAAAARRRAAPRASPPAARRPRFASGPHWAQWATAAFARAAARVERAGPTAMAGKAPPARLRPPAPPPLGEAEAAPQEAAHPLRLAGAGRAGAGLDGLRDDGGCLPGPARDLQLRPVQGVEEQRSLRRPRGADRHPDQQPEQDPAHLRADLPERQERHRLDRGQALLLSTAASTSTGSPGRWSRTSSRAAPSRAPRRSPSSSSRTRSPPRAAARSSRSSARRRSPTGSSATGARTRSSPST